MSDSKCEKSIDEFVESLPVRLFTHRDVCRCYSIYLRNTYREAGEVPEMHVVDQVNRQVVDGKRVPLRWSPAEIEALRAGVEKFGMRNWSKILGSYPLIFGPTGRTGRDLKKKWLSLESRSESTRSARQNDPILVFDEIEQRDEGVK